MRDTRRSIIAVAVSSSIAVACGGSELSAGGPDGSPTPEDAGAVDAGATVDASIGSLDGSPAPEAAGAEDAGAAVDASSGYESGAARACIPGQSVACVGPGGCSSNQICSTDGSSFGPCTCASPASDASTQACVPSESVACSGPGGCISSQVCKSDGSGYGACTCSSDAAALLCIPGQSIECAGPNGCLSYQVCNSTGDSYSACVCPDGGGYDYGDGGLPDGYAPLPPPIGDQGYNAIWTATLDGQPEIIRPLFSAPDCAVVPPYGDYYYVQFQPKTDGPNGTFPSCSGFNPAGGPTPCYAPAYLSGGGYFQGGEGLTYTLSAFDANGIATGQMDTAQGIVPLVVKNCF